VQINALVRGLSLIFLFACATSAMAEAPGDPKSVKQDDKGKNLDAKGDPTFRVKPDGRWTGIPIRASVDTIPNATSATAPMAKAPLTRLLLRIQ